jgi:uncharacterized protein YbjT (DUF2867 family)
VRGRSSKTPVSQHFAEFCCTVLNYFSTSNIHLLITVSYVDLNMPSRKVIVFGPTGAVGSAAARTAHELGANVVLAMRDTNKPIPGLDAEAVQQGNFEKVQADLTKPDTVRDAVSKTGAKYAFIYLAHGSPDHMKATIEALKVAGIDLVVFLSSFTIQVDPKAVEPSEIIPYLHAQVEVNLKEIFGADGYVALRPGSFAGNTLQYKGGLQKGEVKIHGPDAKVDNIVQKDIGVVGGTILATGPQDENRAIYLYGPELISQKDVVKIIAEELGKSIKTEKSDDKEAYKLYVEERKVPPPIAEYLIRRGGGSDAGKQQVFGYTVTDEQLTNVEKYSGKKATTFREWVKQNKDIFVS